jgi:hypothetical protein
MIMSEVCVAETRETEKNVVGTKETNQTKTPELNPDFASQNPLEYDLFRKEAGLELITPNQYRFIKQ